LLATTLKKKEKEENLKPEEARGRQSGSAGWKQARGEQGKQEEKETTTVKDAEKTRFRAKFTENIQRGMKPNEAAAQALKDMQKKE
jgi:hypothetical protein